MTTNYVLNAESGFYNVNQSAGSSDYAMDASAGAYTVTGEAATLAQGQTGNPVLVAQTGGYAITGIPVTMATFVPPGGNAQKLRKEYTSIHGIT